MVCALDKRTDRDRWKANGSARVNAGRQSSDEVQRRVVLLPGVLPLGVEEQLIRRRFLEERPAIQEVFDVVELVLAKAVKGFHVAVPGGAGGRYPHMVHPEKIKHSLKCARF